MRLNREEKKVLEEIEHWQTARFKAGIASAIANAAFYPIERFLDFVIPDKVIEKVTKPMKGILNSLQNSSRRFVNIGDIINKANDAGLEVDGLEGLRAIPIAYLDILAKIYRYI